jgi:hypothetical protein
MDWEGRCLPNSDSSSAELSEGRPCRTGLQDVILERSIRQCILQPDPTFPLLTERSLCTVTSVTEPDAPGNNK